MQQDCLDIQEKLNQNKERYKRAALLFTDFLDDLLSQKPNILHEDAHHHDIDLERIKHTPFEELSKEDKVNIMFTLLGQMQPYFSANNLAVVGTYHQS